MQMCVLLYSIKPGPVPSIYPYDYYTHCVLLLRYGTTYCNADPIY